MVVNICSPSVWENCTIRQYYDFLGAFKIAVYNDLLTPKYNIVNFKVIYQNWVLNWVVKIRTAETIGVTIQ